MANLKNPKADLRATNKRVTEICIILSLALMILAFKYFPDISQDKIQLNDTQELFTVEDIQQTKQESKPPPPPKPPIPIESPSDDVLEDIELEDTEIDFEAQMELPPPPPPKEEKKEETEPQYFVAVEEMPAPIGGIQGIQNRIVYPEIAKRAGVEGRVYVLAFVDETGVVTKVELIKGIGGGCDQAAMDAVRETRFTPGKQRGKPVKVQVMIPIVFKLK